MLNAMQCPYCQNDTKITNSRPRALQTQKWRRRTCKSCQQIWTTVESIDLSTSHRILRSDNSLEPFSRDILFVSIKDALQHRKSALADATSLTDTVLARILLQKSACISTSQIVDTTHTVLGRFDSTAAAVYAAKHASN